jgi:hypothetical protein
MDGESANAAVKGGHRGLSVLDINEENAGTLHVRLKQGIQA